MKPRRHVPTAQTRRRAPLPFCIGRFSISLQGEEVVGLGGAELREQDIEFSQLRDARGEGRLRPRIVPGLDGKLGRGTPAVNGRGRRVIEPKERESGAGCQCEDKCAGKAYKGGGAELWAGLVSRVTRFTFDGIILE